MSNVKFFNGNIKTGDMLTFNKLAGNIEFNGCKGSCGEHCTGCWNTEDWKHSGCYVAKSYVQYKDSIINPHIANTIAMREDPWSAIKELNEQLKRKKTLKTVRIHSAGELEDVEELKAWIWIAKQNPKRKFYIYTKNYSVVDSVLEEVEKNTGLKNLPKNFFINISIWHDKGIECYNRWKCADTIRAFAYDDGNYDYAAAGLEINASCPAYKAGENGKVKLSHDLTCAKCGLCFQKKLKVLKCLSH